MRLASYVGSTEGDASTGKSLDFACLANAQSMGVTGVQQAALPPLGRQ